MEIENKRLYASVSSAGAARVRVPQKELGLFFNYFWVSFVVWIRDFFSFERERESRFLEAVRFLERENRYFFKREKLCVCWWI